MTHRKSLRTIGCAAFALAGIVAACTFAEAPKSDTAAPPAEHAIALAKRSRVEGKVVELPAQWDARETAVVICDMWDDHWCKSAARRCAEIAPGVDALAKSVRAKGGLVIHCPSDTMKFYEGTPARELAKNAPKATPPTPLKGWRYIEPAREGQLPIDDKDGGCDDEPTCPKPQNKQWPWTRQIKTIEVAPGDAVTQDGAEVYNLFAQRKIKHVIVCGVHLNMCVLGRTFAIRQLTDWKFDVVLARDLTDTMYNPRKAPYVSHDKGTELVVEHVEKNWCPTITSEQVVGSKKN
ncbi:MAG: protein-signal peptide and transmembrane prediction [Phycisphaerae bacterium]|nr:hypothetical protein [Tepidisphaeraceae bacterium]